MSPAWIWRALAACGVMPCAVFAYVFAEAAITGRHREWEALLLGACIVCALITCVRVALTHSSASQGAPEANNLRGGAGL